jgi:hypothetical protein
MAEKEKNTSRESLTKNILSKLGGLAIMLVAGEIGLAALAKLGHMPGSMHNSAIKHS